MTVGMRDFFEKISALQLSRQPFATAVVVGRRPPVSGHLGDREIVRKQALDTMRVRHARLVSIRPEASEASTQDPEHVIVPMTCVSEGAVDVYVEPFVPARTLIVVGNTPVAEALTRTALSVEYNVVRVVDSGEVRDIQVDPAVSVLPLASLESVLENAKDGTAVVVASQGHYDEQALEPILRAGVSYVGLVASRKRGASVRALLEENGVPGLENLRSPAGLDLGARTPAEVALSILAEIVQLRPAHATERPGHRRAIGHAADSDAAAGPAVAVDPVCHMEVEVATARHTADVGGTTYYFCCAQCRASFTRNPAQFGVSAS